MFFFIGSSRTGSTWLGQALAKHPNIKLPVKKPVRFWNLKVFGLRDEKSSHPTLSLEAYKELFRDEPGVLKGDITDGYNTLGLQEVLAIRKHHPDAKILQMMRRPSHIVYSHFSLSRSLSEITVEDVRKQVGHPGGYQYHNIRQMHVRDIWSSVFGPENFHLTFYEDFFADPGAGYRDICKFLEVGAFELDPSFLTKRVNKRKHDEDPKDEVRAEIAHFCDPLDREFEEFHRTFTAENQSAAGAPSGAI